MFTQSEKFKNEYCAQVVKINNIEPIENSDFLVRVTVGSGYRVVMSKDTVKEGDIMIYAKMETQLNHEFLSINNQFEFGERNLNKNFKEVQELIDCGKEDEAKKLVGYFNKHGRVRIVKLRGCPSEGCLFTMDTIAKWKPEIINYNLEDCFKPNQSGVIEPFCFDTINGELFCQVYIPKTNEPKEDTKSKLGKRNKKLKKFNRIVDGQFSFHYDTGQLTDNIWRINPDTMVTISNKLHGTSHIVGNILTRKPKTGFCAHLYSRKLNKEYNRVMKYPTRFYWQRCIKKNKLNRISDTINNQYVLSYGPIISSRTVIKNKYINPNPTGGFYNIDIWSMYGDKLYPYLSKGMTVYSEICGYVGNSSSMIQKGYDYGCRPGESFLMPYRITTTDESGNHTEWEVMDVYKWTNEIIKNNPETTAWLKPINILYHGTLSQLYPDVNKNEHWHQNIIDKLREDKANFGMEGNEPMCINKVPREGIIIRIDNDIHAEAFKLKTDAFKFREAKQYDAGEVDMESNESYGV